LTCRPAPSRHHDRAVVAARRIVADQARVIHQLSFDDRVKDVIAPRGTSSLAAVSGAGAWVGPMMKFPSVPDGGSVPSGSSVAPESSGSTGRAWAALF
jgi:hypothetical protein